MFRLNEYYFLSNSERDKILEIIGNIALMQQGKVKHIKEHLLVRNDLSRTDYMIVKEYCRDTEEQNYLTDLFYNKGFYLGKKHNQLKLA